MRRSSLVLTALLLGSLSGPAFAGKKKKKDAAPPPPPAAEAAPTPAPPKLVVPDWVARAPADGVAVNVLEAGQGEAAPLRLSLSEGTETAMSMAMDIEMGMSMGGMQLPSMPLPTQVILMSVVVDDVDEAGNVTFSAIVTDLQFENTDNVDPLMMDGLKQSLTGIVGLKTTATMDTRSRTLDARVDGVDQLTPDMQQQMGNLSGQLQNMALPFPEEPVAPGARWEVLKRTDANGIAVAERHVVTLASRKGDVVELKTQIEQSLADPDFTPAGLPPGTDITMQRFESTGSGRTVQNLGHPVPVEGEATIALQMDMAVRSDDGSMAILPGATEAGVPFSMSMKMKAVTAEIKAD